MSTEQDPQPSPPKLDQAKALRLRQALEADGDRLFALIRDPDPDLVQSALGNPQLGEEHLLALLKRRDLPEQLVKSIERKAPPGSRRLKMALAAHPSTPASLLSAILQQLFLFELVTLLQLPGTPPDARYAAERAILKRLPETELGNKVALARRANPEILAALLNEGEPRLVDAVLANPRLKESGMLAFLKSPAARAETISQVARHPLWGARPNLRLAILRHRATPLVWFTLFLPALGTRDLKSLSSAPGLTHEQLAEVRRELARRG